MLGYNVMDNYILPSSFSVFTSLITLGSFDSTATPFPFPLATVFFLATARPSFFSTSREQGDRLREVESRVVKAQALIQCAYSVDLGLRQVEASHIEVLSKAAGVV